MPDKLPSQNLQFKLILAQDFIGAFCFFAPQALLITYLHDYLRISAGTLSAVLFLMLFFARIGRLFLIPFITCFNIPVLLFTLQVLGGLGFYLLMQGSSNICLYAGAFLVGMFYGNNAILVRITTSFLKTNFHNLNFALLGSVTNLTSSGGALVLSYIFYHFSPTAMLGFICVFMAVTALFTAWSSRHLSFPEQGHFFKTSLSLVRVGKVRAILLIVTILWFCFSFFITLLPLYAIDRLHSPAITWQVTAINGLIALFLSYPVNWVLKDHSDLFKLAASFAIYLLALAILAFDSSLFIFYALLLAISISEIISVPTYQSLLTRETAAEQRLAGFSLTILAVGLGESLGSVFSVMVNRHQNLLFVVMLAILVLMSMGLMYLRKRHE